MNDLNLLIGDEAQTITVYTDDGLGINIRVSNGPHGLGVTLTRKGGVQLPLTMTGNQTGDGEIIFQVDASEVSVTQYRDNEGALTFKTWYGSDKKEIEP